MYWSGLQKDSTRPERLIGNSECQYRTLSGEDDICSLTNGNRTRKNNETDRKRGSWIGVETFWRAQLQKYYRCDDDSNVWIF